MDPLAKAVCFIIAILFAVGAAVLKDPRSPKLFPLAFAVFVLPACWDAVEQA